MPPLVDSVFLELSGLDRNLPLRLHVRADGPRLPGLHVRGRIQTSAARHPAANADPGAAGFPQGEMKYSVTVYFIHRVACQRPFNSELKVALCGMSSLDVTVARERHSHTDVDSSLSSLLLENSLQVCCYCGVSC